MLRFIGRRILETIPVLWVVATMTFFLIRLTPGGPFDREKATTPEIRKALEAQYHLDRPLLVQYFSYLRQLLRGDLGPSFKYANRRVNELIFDAFPASLELGCLSLALALLIGVSAGFLAAVRQNSFWDYSAMGLAMVGICLPTFVLGPLLMLVLAIHFKWFNAIGWDFARDRVLPSLTLGFFYAAYIARLTRGGMLEILNQDSPSQGRLEHPNPG
jgi:oligopeptide transport system permease protein